MSEPINVRLCVVVCERNVSDLLRTVEVAGAEANMIELRLDCLQGFDQASLDEIFARLPQRESLTVIVTLRPPTQGGNNMMVENWRFAFWHTQVRRLMSARNILVDVEADIVADWA